MDRKVLYALGIGAAVLVITAGVTYPRDTARTNEEWKFMHCPNCNKEMPYNADKLGEGCPRCGPEYPLKPTPKQLADMGERANPYARMFALVLLEINVLLGVVLYLHHFRGAGKQPLDYLYTNCPRCKQRLRYPQSKVGKAGLCPRCRRGLVFPEPVPDEIDA